MTKKYISNGEFVSIAVEELEEEYDHKCSFDISWLFDELDKDTQTKIISVVRNQQVMVKDYGEDLESTQDEDYALESFNYGITSNMVERFAEYMPLAKSQTTLKRIRDIEVEPAGTDTFNGN